MSLVRDWPLIFCVLWFLYQNVHFDGVMAQMCWCQHFSSLECDIIMSKVGLVLNHSCIKYLQSKFAVNLVKFRRLCSFLDPCPAKLFHVDNDQDNRQGGIDFFWEEKRGAKIFLGRKKGGGDFFLKKIKGARTYLKEKRGVNSFLTAKSKS